MVRSKQHKLIRFDFSSFEAWAKNPLVGVEEGFVLFDLAADPGERLDVIEKNPEVAERMRRALVAFGGAADSGQLSQEDAETFDPETRERLRAMGYIE